MKTVHITGNSINDAWFKALKATIELGHEYTIDKGEYQGSKRKELDLAVIKIRKPSIRPLACQSQYITPATDDQIEKYFHDYLLNPEFESEKERERNEYKYATWIGSGNPPRWEQCCRLLLSGEGGCNQATISIGEEPGIQYDQPPYACYRHASEIQQALHDPVFQKLGWGRRFSVECRGGSAVERALPGIPER